MVANFLNPLITAELQKIGLTKFELLEFGVRVTPVASEYLRGAKSPLRTRSGSSGGLDLILPQNVHVNTPVDESIALKSDLFLDYIEGELVIRRKDEVITTAHFQARPKFYGQKTSDGVPMSQIAQMCSGDRFCYGMTGSYCWFWKKERRCKYCSIGLNKDRDSSKKTISQLLEVLELAVNDPQIPAKHVLIGGGTPDGEDMGAILASQICREIKKRFSLSCYVMISAPLHNQYIDMVKDSGADELGLNIEFFSEDAWRSYIPGKLDYIGRRRYFEALEYAVSVFGPIHTRSLMIVGLENEEFTIQGAEQLASMGVMPILSPFRALAGTELENRRGFSYLNNWRIYEEVVARAARYSIPVGPTCIACQNNTLALPLNSTQYRIY